MSPIETVIILVIALFVLIVFLKTARVVPQKTVFIIERLGKYRATLEAGFHILVPFMDKVAYRHSLKEFAVDVPPQHTVSCRRVLRCGET